MAIVSEMLSGRHFSSSQHGLAQKGLLITSHIYALRLFLFAGHPTVLVSLHSCPSQDCSTDLASCLS